jgi:ankyrin repeat protein
MTTLDSQQATNQSTQSLGDVINQDNGNTALMQLIITTPSNPQMLSTLATLSAKQLGLTKRNKDGFNAVHLALLKGDVDVVRELLKKAHNLVNDLDIGKNGYSLLQCAVLSQNRYLIQEVSRYSNDLKYINEDGMNALEVSLTGSVLVINFMAVKYDIVSLEKAIKHLEDENVPFYDKHNKQAKSVLENIIEQKRSQL